MGTSESESFGTNRCLGSVHVPGTAPEPGGATCEQCIGPVGRCRTWSAQLSVLEIRGRRSRKPVRFPIVVADYEGERYLVSMLGENTN